MAPETPGPATPSQPPPPTPPGQWRQGGWYGPRWPWIGRGSFWGVLLVLLGVWFLLDNLGLLRWVRGDVVWPIVLILVGVALIVTRGRWWR